MRIDHTRKQNFAAHIDDHRVVWYVHLFTHSGDFAVLDQDRTARQLITHNRYDPCPLQGQLRRRTRCKHRRH